MEDIEIRRLDQKVVELVPELSRSTASKLIEQGKVRVNGQTVLKSSYKVHNTDKVKVDFKPSEFKYPKIKLPVIYEDKDCVVINKPVGLLTHSKGAFNPEATVATWLRSKTQDLRNIPLLKVRPFTDNKNADLREGIVHRLDRATSGVMICAKTPGALKYLQKQFSQRKVKKTYIAIVEGRLKNQEAVIDMPIERNPKAPATFRVGAGGKPAITRYKVIKESEKYSLLELKPETGRTHQLRVHLAQLGHPIVGDNIYKGRAAERMFLHALELEITLPSHERKTFKAPLPKSFGQQMKADDA